MSGRCLPPPHTSAARLCISMQDKYQAGSGTYAREGYIYASIVGIQQSSSSSSDSQVRVEEFTAQPVGRRRNNTG